MDYALHVGMEGEEATQEVITRQEELRVLHWLSQGLQQEEQGAGCPALGSHGWEMEVSEVTLPPRRADNLTQGICTDIYILVLLLFMGQGSTWDR